MTGWRARRRCLRLPRPGRPLSAAAPKRGSGRRTRSAHGEPGPAQRETGDHVREPVDVEQHAARGDRDGDPDRETGEHRARRTAAPPAEQKRRRGIERGRCRRVAARERRPERRRRGVEGRAHPVGELLHRQRQDLLAGHDRDDERHDPDAPLPDRLCDGEDETERDDRVDAPELRDGRSRPCVDSRESRDGSPTSPRRCRSRSSGSSCAPGTRALRAARRRRSRGAARASAQARSRPPDRVARPGRRAAADACRPSRPTLRAVSSAGAAAGARDPRIPPDDEPDDQAGGQSECE